MKPLILSMSTTQTINIQKQIDIIEEQLKVRIDEASRNGSPVNLSIPATPEIISFLLDKVFKCKRCGSCCQGLFPNATEIQRKEGIPVSDNDIERIAISMKVRPRKIKRLCQLNSREG